MLSTISRALSSLAKSELDADLDANWDESGGLVVKVGFAGQSFTVVLEKEEVDEILAKRPKGE